MDRGYQPPTNLPAGAKSPAPGSTAATERLRLAAISADIQKDLAAKKAAAAAARARAAAESVAQLTRQPAPRPAQQPAQQPARTPIVTDGQRLNATINAEGRMKVLGRVQKVLFENSGFYFVRVAPHDAQSRDDEYLVKGHGIDLVPGREVVVVGNFKVERSERYGQQNVIDGAILFEVIPTSRMGIQRLLENGYVKGIGPQSARALCDKFDRHLFDIAEFAPEKLYQANIVKPAQVSALVRNIREKKELPRLMSFLAEVGLGIQASHKVLQELGPGAVEMIKRNPYELTRVASIGFSKADEVARARGLATDSDQRIAAAIEAVLEAGAKAGWTYLQIPDLKERMAKLLSADHGESRGSFIDPIRLSHVVDAELESSRKLIVRERSVAPTPQDDGRYGAQRERRYEKVVSLVSYAGAERRIARKLADLLALPCTPESRGARPGGAFFDKLWPEQQAAVRTSLASTVSVITGRPGCGKTTVTKAIVQAMRAAGLEVLLMGPTNRAANQLTAATGQRATTLHRGLGCRGANMFAHGPDNPLQCDVVIADECSMSDTMITDRLLSAMRPGMSLVLVGDVEQLASIGAGKCLSDVIESGVLPVSRLTKSGRTSAESSINPNAYRVCDRLPPLQPGPGENDDFQMREVRSARPNAPEDEQLAAERRQVGAVVAQFKAYLAKGHKPEDIQILTPMRHKTALGTNALNAVMKNLLNPVTDDPDASITTRSYRNPKVFSVGDRVMYTENDPDRDIYNGDIAYVHAIDHESKHVSLDFDGRIAEIEFRELSDIDHAYVNTVHKTQGGEFPAVIMVVVAAHSNMNNRQLLYTGMTRGKKDVCLVGDTHRLQEVVEKAGSETRQTMLDDELVRAVASLQAKPSQLSGASRRMRP